VPESPDRVFLDANVLFSAAYSPGSGLHRLWELAQDGRIELLASSYVVEEARRNLTSGLQIQRLEKLLTRVRISACRARAGAAPAAEGLAQKDRPFLQAALAMDATHLLTGDIAHFGSLLGKWFEGVLVLLPGDYLSRTGKGAR